MIRGKHFLCAEFVIRDAESNGISLINLLEQAVPQGFPALLPRLAVLLLLERDPGDPNEITYTFKVRMDEDPPLFEQSVTSGFQGQLSTRQIMIVGGLPIPHPGKLRLTAATPTQTLGDYVIPIQPPNQPTVSINATT